MKNLKSFKLFIESLQDDFDDSVKRLNLENRMNIYNYETFKNI